MKTIIGILVVLALAVEAQAQSARQGATEADPTEFHSPMVLEIDFAAANPVFWQKKQSDVWIAGGNLRQAEKGRESFKAQFLIPVPSNPFVSSLSVYHCDGVSIRNLLLSPTIEKDNVETRIKVWTLNTGHDKQVKLLLELFNGDTKVGETTIGPFKDEEGDITLQKGLIRAAQKDLLMDPQTKLRITMTNWDF